mgnify:CR=1 FL=1
MPSTDILCRINQLPDYRTSVNFCPYYSAWQWHHHPQTIFLSSLSIPSISASNMAIYSKPWIPRSTMLKIGNPDTCAPYLQHNPLLVHSLSHIFLHPAPLLPHPAEGNALFFPEAPPQFHFHYSEISRNKSSPSLFTVIRMFHPHFRCEYHDKPHFQPTAAI